MTKVASVLLVLLGLIGGPASAVSLCEYRSPETSIHEFDLSINYQYLDDGATPGVEVNSGWIALDLRRLVDGPRIGYSLTGLARLSLNDLVPTEFLGQGSGSVKYYFREAPAWFGFAGFEGAGSLSAKGLDVRAGVGYGRFADVTPMAKAMHILDELKELAVLEGDLSDETLLAVAMEIGRADEFEETRDLVEAVEDLIEADVGSDLGTQALLSIESIILQPSDTRSCGWTIQAGVGYEVIDPNGGSRNALLALSGDFAWSRTRLEASELHAAASIPLAASEAMTMNISAVHEQEIAERLSIEARLAWQRIGALGAPSSSVWLASVSAQHELDRGSIGLQASIGRDDGDADLSTSLSISASLDLL